MDTIETAAISSNGAARGASSLVVAHSHRTTMVAPVIVASSADAKPAALSILRGIVECAIETRAERSLVP